MALSPFLRKRLVWPLLAASGLAFVGATLIPWQGLLVNLGTTFLGILITISYVDLILRQHEQERWSATRARVAKRVEWVGVVAASQFRSAFGISPSVIDPLDYAVASDSQRRAEIRRVTQQWILPAVEHAIPALSTQQWAHLSNQIALTSRAADSVLQLFGNHLEPGITTLLLDLQDSMRAFTVGYETFPDVLGVPPGNLQPNLKGESSLPLQESLQTMAVRDCRTILALSTDLLLALDVRTSV